MNTKRLKFHTFFILLTVLWSTVFPAADVCRSESRTDRLTGKAPSAPSSSLRQMEAEVMGVTPQMVQNAISGGVEYLKATQNRNGSWEEQDIHIGGISALCTLALLNAGVPIDDPKMARALDHLRSIDPTSGTLQSNYVAALQTMVFCMADPKRDAGLIRRNVLWFIQTQKEKGLKPGSWGYPYGDGDPSNSQFTLLALYEASQLGLNIPPEVWENAQKYWEKIQNMDGSWSYYYFPPELERQTAGTGSMTCAGIVSLLIAAEKSQLADARIEGEEFIPCQRQENRLTKRLSHARSWMEKHFSVARNPGNKDWLLYYLYGLERMGRMTEQRFIGGHDWYREGTAHLLRLSKMVDREDKLLVYWEGATSSEKIKPIATSLALLFLSKGRYPVLMTKVQFTKETEDWNQHRHDISHLARFVERKWKKHLTTQSVDLEAASVEDLLLSPVLFISGKDSPCPKDPVLRAEYGRKLRDYVDRGGFIVAEGVCPGGTFDDGMRQLLREIFPEEEEHLYPMPPEHPIWSAEAAVPPQYVRPIYCLDYGCRTCLLFLPAEKNPRPSLSCLWELAPEMRPGALHSANVKREILAGMNLGLNILAYVTERKLRGKEESFASFTKEADKKLQEPEEMQTRGKLRMANLRHGGGCEAAPEALRNLLRQAQTALGNTSGILEETLPLSSPRIFEYPVLFMQGRYAFRFTPAERKMLAEYLDRGGILLVNSICGAEAFDAAFRSEMREVLRSTGTAGTGTPGNAEVQGRVGEQGVGELNRVGELEEIPLSDPLCTDRLGGFALSEIRSRAEKNAEPVPLQLLGIRKNGRWAVIYSPLDLSCALEGHPSAGCVGYRPEDAAKIGINVILYSMQ